MRRTIIGALRLSGLSKKNGRNYDFTKLNVLISYPAENIAAGFEQQQLNATPDVIQQLQRVQLPAEFELTHALDETSRTPRVIITGVTPVKKQAAA